MIQFEPINLSNKERYNSYLLSCGERGCEYNLSNLYLWGRQRTVFFPNGLAFFSHFTKRNVYLFPLYRDNPQEILDAIIADARERGILCSLTSLCKEDCELLEKLYPGQFAFHIDRDAFDYVYAIGDLADLKGRKFQKKRNHLNKFKQTHPDYTVEPITEENTQEALDMLDTWYARYAEANPMEDITMEKVAMLKAMRCREALGMEGIVLRHDGKILALTMGCPIAEHTFDVQFEKAVDETAYAAINWLFANYLRDKYPDLLWLNREDDLGLEGLRKAKLSYNPDHMVEKWWARLLETGYDY